MINTVLSKAFPDDPVVGEEDSGDLRRDTEPARLLRERVVQLANDALSPTANTEETSSPQNLGAWGLGSARTEAELLDAIERGAYAGGAKGRTCTFWNPYVLFLLTLSI